MGRRGREAAAWPMASLKEKWAKQASPCGLGRVYTRVRCEGRRGCGATWARGGRAQAHKERNEWDVPISDAWCPSNRPPHFSFLFLAMATLPLLCFLESPLSSRCRIPLHICAPKTPHAVPHDAAAASLLPPPPSPSLFLPATSSLAQEQEELAASQHGHPLGSFRWA